MLVQLMPGGVGPLPFTAMFESRASVRHPQPSNQPRIDPSAPLAQPFSAEESSTARLRLVEGRVASRNAATRLG